MQLILFNKDKHYDQVKGWWEAHNWPPINADFLPNTGYIIESDGVNVVAGWLYITNSPFGIFEWVISNPKVEKAERREALDMLISAVNKLAVGMGVKCLYTSTEHEGFIGRLESHGYQVTDRKVSNLINILPEG